jgi:hypothetical protein
MLKPLGAFWIIAPRPWTKTTSARLHREGRLSSRDVIYRIREAFSNEPV